jgi:hypothetical protein
MRPLAHRVSDRRPGLKHDEALTALGEVSGGGEPYGAGTNNGDRKLGIHGYLLQEVSR